LLNSGCGGGNILVVVVNWGDVVEGDGYEQNSFGSVITLPSRDGLSWIYRFGNEETGQTIYAYLLSIGDYVPGG
jgi:hypothetical protein